MEQHPVEDCPLRMASAIDSRHIGRSDSKSVPRTREGSRPHRRSRGSTSGLSGPGRGWRTRLSAFRRCHLRAPWAEGGLDDELPVRVPNPRLIEDISARRIETDLAQADAPLNRPGPIVEVEGANGDRGSRDFQQRQKKMIGNEKKAALLTSIIMVRGNGS